MSPVAIVSSNSMASNGVGFAVDERDVAQMQIAVAAPDRAARAALQQ